MTEPLARGFKRQQIELMEQAVMNTCQTKFSDRHFWRDITDELGQPLFVIKFIPAFSKELRIIYKRGRIVTLLISGTTLYNGNVGLTSKHFWDRLKVALTNVKSLLIKSPLEYDDDVRVDSVSDKDKYSILQDRGKKMIRHKELMAALGNENVKHRFFMRAITTTATVYDEVNNIEVTVTVPGYFNYLSDLKGAILAAVMQEFEEEIEDDNISPAMDVQDTIPNTSTNNDQGE